MYRFVNNDSRRSKLKFNLYFTLILFIACAISPSLSCDALDCNSCISDSTCVWCVAGDGSSKCANGGIAGPADDACTSFYWVQCDVPGNSNLVYVFVLVCFALGFCCVCCCGIMYYKNKKKLKQQQEQDDQQNNHRESHRHRDTESFDSRATDDDEPPPPARDPEEPPPNYIPRVESDYHIVQVQPTIQGQASIADRELECPVCIATKKDTVVIPCGHRFCYSCAYLINEKQHRCPVCREGIVQIVKYY